MTHKDRLTGRPLHKRV